MRLFLGSLLCSVCLPALACAQSTVSDPTAGADAAKTIFNDKIKAYAGSRQAVQDNLLKPLVSGGTLKSIGGTVSFAATSLTTSNSALMRVSVFGNPSTGDLLKIIVEQDLNGSGNFNSASVFPIPSEASGKMISTVCANGYVMCDPGTSDNCLFREWDVGTNGEISSVVAGGNAELVGTVGSISPLSGCYCFNKSCTRNNSSTLNIDDIAANVGGGILAAFISSKKGMMVTAAKSSETGQITYYGVATDSVPTASQSMTAEQIATMPVMAAPSVTEIQAYYKNPSSISSLAESARQKQTGAPSSIYNSVVAASQGNAGSTIECSNIVQPSLSLQSLAIQKPGVSDASSKVCVDHLVYAVLTQTAPGKFSLGLVGTSNSGLSAIGYNCPGYFTFNQDLNFQAKLIDQFEIVQPTNMYGYEVTSVSADLTLSGSGCTSGTVSVQWLPGIGLNNPIVVKSSLLCSANDAQWPTYKWGWSVEYKSQDLSTVATLGCSELEKNADCMVKQETWDGRPVVVNGLSTGFKLGQVCQDIAGPLRSAHICTPPERLWFRQNKAFYCKNPTTYDFTEAGKRAKGIQDSANMPTDSSAIYADMGGINSFGMPEKGGASGCSQVCRTKVPATDSAMLYTGQPASANLTTKGVIDQSWSFFYKDCVGKADGSWECPLDTTNGEQVVTACGCSSDLGAVIGALTAANEAAQDSICSKK